MNLKQKLYHYIFQLEGAYGTLMDIIEIFERSIDECPDVFEPILEETGLETPILKEKKEFVEELKKDGKLGNFILDLEKELNK